MLFFNTSDYIVYKASHSPQKSFVLQTRLLSAQIPCLVMVQLILNWHIHNSGTSQWSQSSKHVDNNGVSVKFDHQITKEWKQS